MPRLQVFPPENKLFSVGILLGFFFKVNVVASATAAMIIRNFWESKAVCHQPRLAPEAQGLPQVLLLHFMGRGPQHRTKGLCLWQERETGRSALQGISDLPPQVQTPRPLPRSPFAQFGQAGRLSMEILVLASTPSN